MSKMKKKYNTLKSYINISVGISISTAFFILSYDNIVEEINNDLVRGILIILLLLVSLGWYANYLFTNITDLETYSSLNLVEKISSLSIKEFWLIMILSLLFGALISSSTNILIFSAISVTLELFDIFGDIKVMSNLNNILLRENFYGGKKENKILIAIYDFWFNNPTLQRDILILFFFFVSLISAIINFYTDIKFFNYLSYTICILTIVLSEFIIYKWRKKRDIIIDKFENK